MISAASAAVSPDFFASSIFVFRSLRTVRLLGLSSPKSVLKAIPLDAPRQKLPSSSALQNLSGVMLWRHGLSFPGLPVLASFLVTGYNVKKSHVLPEGERCSLNPSGIPA